MKRKSMMINVLVVTALVLAFGFIGTQTSVAVEEHHQPDTTKKAPASTQSSGAGMMMSHMMGGPGGMGKMMAQMGSGMMGKRGGPGGMARMGQMLDNW